MDLSKLGITSGPWERWPEDQYNDYFDDEIEDTAGMIVAKTKDDPWTLATLSRGQPGEEKDGDVIAAAPEMLEALIEEVSDAEYVSKKEYAARFEHHERWKDTRYMIPIIEKATGISWEEVKRRLEVEGGEDD